MPTPPGARPLSSLTPKMPIWHLALPDRAHGAAPKRKIMKAIGNRWKSFASKFAKSFDKELSTSCFFQRQTLKPSQSKRTFSKTLQSRLPLEQTIPLTSGPFVAANILGRLRAHFGQ